MSEPTMPKEAFGTCDDCGRDIFTEDEGWICNLCPECFQRWREECHDALMTSRYDAVSARIATMTQEEQG